jgi:hypothetical protein
MSRRKSLKVYDLLMWLKEGLSNDNVKVELLNTKEDLAKTFNRIKCFIQYVGIDYKNPKAGVGVAKFAVYVVGKTIFNNDDSIVKNLDTLRERVLELNDDNNLIGECPAYLTDRIGVIEEKFNNTDTLEFIYSLVIGVPVAV